MLVVTGSTNASTWKLAGAGAGMLEKFPNCAASKDCTFIIGIGSGIPKLVVEKVGNCMVEFVNDEVCSKVVNGDGE